MTVNVADLVSTRYGMVRHNIEEQNPLMRIPFAGQVAVKTFATVGVIYFMRKFVYPKNPKGAKIFMVASTMLVGAIATSNIRLIIRLNG